MAWRDDRLAPADIAGYPVSRVNPVEWTILAEHGIRLRGPDADTIGIHQDRDELTVSSVGRRCTTSRRP